MVTYSFGEILNTTTPLVINAIHVCREEDISAEISLAGGGNAGGSRRSQPWWPHQPIKWRISAPRCGKFSRASYRIKPLANGSGNV